MFVTNRTTGRIRVTWLTAILSGLTLSAVAAEGTLPRPIADAADIDAYRMSVESIETQVGAYAPGLSEQLLSLGLALQQQGRHKEAIDHFKRGTHLTRINNGLYSASQIPLIQGEITSHIAMGELVKADQRQLYMYQVQQRSLNNPDSRTDALMQQAQWQYQAYQMRIGATQFERLLNMSNLYRIATGEVAEREGNTSIKLLTPLYGLLQTEYLISSYQGADAHSASSSEPGLAAQQNQFNAYRSKSYKQGQAIIRAIYDVEIAQTDEQFLATAESLVQLGDWQLWNGEISAAEKTYREALRELAELDDAQQQVERLFGEPVPLPAIDSIRPLPAIVAAEEGNILVEFDVTKRGKVTNLSRLDDNEELDGKANRLLRKLRKTPFRPRFENQNPVSTESISHAYKLP